LIESRRQIVGLPAEVASVLYKQKFSLLHEAVLIIAGRLAVADAQSYPDAASAVDDARRQLLEALFEGAVYSEGVTWHNVPPTYEPPSIEYDKWTPIDPGLWSHERCHKENDTYRLDTITVHWNNDAIEYFDSDGEWAECADGKIRLRCADIEREFPDGDITKQDSGPEAAPAGPPYMTGVAGRPSSRDLVRQQMQHRAEEGKLCGSLAEEIRELREWLKKCHPGAARPTAKALANGLRHEYNKLKRSSKSSP
jgi:hypothetical protein